MNQDLAFVTGTSRGIGHAVAVELLARGVEVVGVSRDEPADLDAGYRHYRCDLADLDAVARVFDEVIPCEVSIEGRRRVGLVNNAAVLDCQTVAASDLDGLERAFRVNAVVPIWLHGWLLRHTAHDQQIRIVDVSSGAAQSAIPGWSAYCATKAALRMAGAVLGAELDEVGNLAGRDLSIVSYAPGVVATEMQAGIRSAEVTAFPRRARFVDLHQNGELLAPEVPAREIAELVLDDALCGYHERRCQSR